MADQKPDFWDQTWDAAASVIRTVAPTLATAIGGPLAGTAVKVIADAIFGSGERSPADVSATIASGLSPAQLLSLKSAEQQFILDMKKADIDILRLDGVDRSDARGMQIATRSQTTTVIAAMTIFSFFGMTLLILLGYSKVDNTLGGLLIGTVGAKAGQVYNFMFGSSEGSRGKDAYLAQSKPANS